VGNYLNRQSQSQIENETMGRSFRSQMSFTNARPEADFRYRSSRAARLRSQEHIGFELPRLPFGRVKNTTRVVMFHTRSQIVC